MFLCSECHNHNQPGDYRHQGGSFGGCESCGKMRSCTDCKWIPTQEWRDAMDNKLKAARKASRAKKLASKG